MEPQYYDYYKSAFSGELSAEEWHELPPEKLDSHLREVIADADNRLRERQGVGLRPDAQLFLLINFREMIARPLDAYGTEHIEDIRDRGGLSGALKEDVRTVVEEAAREADEEDVSSHEVVNALDRTWGRLVTLRWGVWDRS